MCDVTIQMQPEDFYAEVLFNRCYGGFSFSKQAMREYFEKTGLVHEEHNQGRDISRTDPVMIEIVKRLGKEASGTHANIDIHHVPKKYKDFFFISEYDGYESVGILYYKYKLHEIQAAVGVYEGSELKDKINGILAETGDDDDE